ncbi:MAG: O-methyltransferase [Chlorobiota bacterium]|nr:MAG: O-methyltransferase [Chlorobiota bacterium]
MALGIKNTEVTNEIYQYLVDNFSGEDELLMNLRNEAKEVGIPEICISPEQCKFLQVFIKSIKAKRIIEVGTLGGYSAIVMARALPLDGKLITIEVDPFRGEFARSQIAKAGLSGKIEVLIGSGVDVLEKTINSSDKFDFAFIDADKISYVRYLDLILPLMNKGGVITGDNALAWGLVHDENTDNKDVKAIQSFNNAMKCNPLIESCIVPVGDGMCMGIVL